MYFSMNMSSIPKAFLASFLALLKASSKSSSFLTILIPLPPPPAAAFTITGYPQYSATFNASSSDVIGFSTPGITGTPTLFATILDFILSPNLSIISCLGPINSIPASSHFFANSAFSDKNP